MASFPFVSFELRDEYLLVIGHGRRDDFKSMVEASTQIYEKVLETNSKYLLVDYRKLEVNVNLSEAFNIVKRYETIQPQFKNVIIAAVFEGNGLEFASYWKDIGSQRGFFIEIFEDFAVAERWLLERALKDL